METYDGTNPIDAPVPADRQGARRHYGVHPYFTRRPYNVVRRYVQHYSRQGDRVLDPFGGSGVTAIEAFLENRTGIQNDINPLANFIAEGIVGLSRGNLSDYKEALAILEQQCAARIRQISVCDNVDLSSLPEATNLPENINLQSNSDVRSYRDLFSAKQLTSLALLRHAIDELPNQNAREGMLLAWSATLTKLNKTFLSAEGRAESRGGSSIFSIYRYKVAKQPIELPPWETFRERALNILAAKTEIDKEIDVKRRSVGWFGKFEIFAKDIDELADELADSIDYIFTDPPYGGHISYLDLSILWNAWLGRIPSVQDREKELIVGGELGLSEEVYIQRLATSVQACIKMLKKGRWLSIVFQHWNTAYFDAILSSAATNGADLRAAISQIGDPIWSMHKKKGNQTVLAGELILTFYKTGTPKGISRANHFDVAKTVREILSATTSEKLYGEYIFNRVVIEAWKKSAVGSLAISKTEFVALIKQSGWHYDEEEHVWARDRSPEQASLFCGT
jgi:DNA modification methylase